MSEETPRSGDDFPRPLSTFSHRELAYLRWLGCADWSLEELIEEHSRHKRFSLHSAIREDKTLRQGVLRAMEVLTLLVAVHAPSDEEALKGKAGFLFGPSSEHVPSAHLTAYIALLTEDAVRLRVRDASFLRLAFKPKR